MRFAPLLPLVFAGFASAQWKRLLAEEQLPAANGLAPRAGWDDKTCAERWGPGFIICSLYNCFNPTEEQCCANGYTCDGSDISCCGTFGPGVTGTDGVPATSTLATPLTPPGSTPTSLTCSPDESGEECCQRSSSFLHWCSGSFGSYNCYNPSSQNCCSDGTMCFGDGCCDAVGATAIAPNVTQATARPSGGGSITSVPNTVAGATKTTQMGSASSTSLAATTGTNIGVGGADTRNTIGGIAIVALGALGMVLL